SQKKGAYFMAGSGGDWRRTRFYFRKYSGMERVYIFSLIWFRLFLLNFLLLHTFRLPQFLSSYLNDLLFMQLLLRICLFPLRRFGKKKQLKISLFSCLSLAALYSIYFEIYLPKVTQRYTADPVDALLYFIGAIVFYLLQKDYSEFKIQDSKSLLSG